MDCKIIAERRLKSDWEPKIDDDCEAFHLIDAEEELAYVLAKQIRDEMNNGKMLDDGGICGTRLRPSKRKYNSKKKKEYFGDMRLEDCDELCCCDSGPKGTSGVVYAPWIPTGCTETVTNSTPIKSRYSKTKVNNTFYGDIKTTNNI